MKLARFWHKNRLEIVAAAAAVFTFVILCATQIARNSSWFDESFTHFLIKFNLFDIAKWTASDVHPPLFYWLLKTWSLVFGGNIVALRAFSTFCGGVAIALGFFLARKLFGRKVGFLSLPLLALSPMLIRYGIEARMYTLCVVIVFAQVLVLLRFRENPSRRNAIFYGILLAIGVWTQYFVALASVAQLAFVLCDIRHPNNLRGPKMWRQFFAGTTKKQRLREILFSKTGNLSQSAAVAILLFLPWLSCLIYQFTTVTTGGFWIPSVSLTSFSDLLATTFLYRTAADSASFFALGLMVILIITIVLLCLLFKRGEKNENDAIKKNLILLLAVIIIPPLLLFIISLPPMRSYFIDRYVIYSTLAAAVFVAALVGLSWKKSYNLKAELRANCLPASLYILTLVAFITGFCAVIYYGNYNKFTSEKSTAQYLMLQIGQETSAAKIPVVADSAWSFYDADVYASSRNPVYFLRSQADDFYYGSEKMLAGSSNEIADLKTWLMKSHIKKVWYISASDQASNPPAELGSDAQKWLKITSVSADAPNDWRGSSQAVLYEIK